MNFKYSVKAVLIFLFGTFMGVVFCLVVMDKKVDYIVEHQSLLGRNVFLSNILSDIKYISNSRDGVVTCDIVQSVFLKHSNLLLGEAEGMGDSKIPLVDHLLYAQSLVRKSESLKLHCGNNI